MRVLTESGSVDLWRCERDRNDRGEGHCNLARDLCCWLFFAKLTIELGSNFSLLTFIVSVQEWKFFSRRNGTKRSILSASAEARCINRQESRSP